MLLKSQIWKFPGINKINKYYIKKFTQYFNDLMRNPKTVPQFVLQSITYLKDSNSKNIYYYCMYISRLLVRIYFNEYLCNKWQPSFLGDSKQNQVFLGSRCPFSIERVLREKYFSEFLREIVSFR